MPLGMNPKLGTIMSIKERWRKFKPLPEDIRGRVANLSSLFEREGVLLAYLFGLTKDVRCF